MKEKFISLAVIAVTIMAAAPAVYADNPIVQTVYTADPAPLVYNDTMYVYTSHDEPEGGENGAMYVMNDWKLYSSKDMVNWTDMGTPLSYKVFEWSRGDAWAIQVVHNKRDGKFYLYAPVNVKNGGNAIGVAVADRPEGPFVDAIGKPLVEGYGLIDPTVFFDTNGDAYIYYGNPQIYYGKLNEDMISFAEGPEAIPLTVESFGDRETASDSRNTGYEEAPWAYERDGKYYLIFAQNLPEDMSYAMADSPHGPWKYMGKIMPQSAFNSIGGSGTFTNHMGIVDYRDRSYFFYHEAKLPGSNGFRRSAAVEEFEYNADGTIPFIQPTLDGPEALQYVDPYSRVEAETIARAEWVTTDEYYTNASGERVDTFTNDDTKNVFVNGIENGDFIKVNEVDFGSMGAGTFTAAVACAGNGGEIELRLDSADGQLIGTLPLSYTGGNDEWQKKTTAVSGATGLHDLYLVFRGESRETNLFGFDYWRFTERTDEKKLAAINAVIDEHKIDIKENANTANLKVTAIYSDGTSEDVTSAAAVTASPANAIYDNGVITGTAYGETNLTVSYGGISEKIHLFIKDMDTELTVSSLSVNPSEIKLVYGGTSETFTVTAEYADGHTEDVTDKAVYENPKLEIAAVSNGVAAPRRVGTAMVNISYQGKIGGAASVTLPVIVTANIIENGDMENGTASWSTNGTASIESSDNAAGGEKSLFVSGRGDTGSGAKQLVAGKIQAGKTYRFSAKVKYTDGVAERDFNLTLHNDDWHALESTEDSSWNDVYGFHVFGSVRAKKGEWATISGEVTIPSDVILSKPALFVETSWVASPTKENDLMDYYIDDVTLYDTASDKPELCNATYNGGIISAELKNAEGYSYVIYAAERAKDGRIIGVSTIQEDAETGNESIGISYEKQDADSVIDLYVWDSRQVPLCPKTTIQ